MAAKVAANRERERGEGVKREEKKKEAANSQGLSDCDKTGMEEKRWPGEGGREMKGRKKVARWG